MELEPLRTAGRNVKIIQMLCKKVWGLLEKLHMEPPQDPAIPLRVFSNRYLHPRVLSGVIHNRHKAETTQVSVDKWEKVISKMEYYSALKRKEILTGAPTWVNLEDTVPSEVGQRTNTA